MWFGREAYNGHYSGEGARDTEKAEKQTNTEDYAG